MVGFCCVPSCHQRFVKQKDQGCSFEEKITFVRLPYRDEELLQKWLEAITRDEEKEIKFSYGTLLCSQHFDEDDFYRGYVNGRRHLKDGAVPHVFTSRPSKTGTGGRSRPVPSAAALIKKIMGTTKYRVVLGQLEQTPSSDPVVATDAGLDHDYGLAPNADSAVDAENCEDEAEEEEEAVDCNPAIMDPVHTYCKPKPKGGIEEVSAEPYGMCSDESTKVLNWDETSPTSMSHCSVRIIASSMDDDRNLDLDAMTIDIEDNGVHIDSNQGTILPDDVVSEMHLETDRKVPIELLDPPSHVTHGPVHLEDAHSSNSEQSAELQGLPKRVFELEKEIERMHRVVEWYSQEVTDAKKEKDQLAKTAELLEQKCRNLEKWRFTIENFQHKPKDVHFYTGLPDYAAFEDLFQCLIGNRVGRVAKSRAEKRLSKRDKLFVCLVRWRLGLPERDLAFRFHLSCCTISRVCHKWIKFIYQSLGRLRSSHRLRRKGPASAGSATELVSDCNRSTADSDSRQEELSDTGRVVKSLSSNTATIFVCPPMDMELARKVTQAYDPQEGPCSDGSVDVEVVDMLCEAGLPLNTSRLLGHHRIPGGSLPTADDIVSLRDDVERAIPEIQNYRIFYQPLLPSLLPLAHRLLAICVVLTNFSKS
uniref:THAP domain containing, apoptosis associated protein 2 family protein n=1 Tax=Rhipicephalus appendiculatus TaxID=34631 RepID=A0A131YKM4_RHIAP